MKYITHKAARHVSLLLALLLLGPASLTACTGGKDPSTDTADTQTAAPAATAGEEMTLGEPDTADPTQTAAPENNYTPPESLIGDGSETAGVFPVFSETGGLYTDRTKTVEITAPEGYTVRYTTDGSVPTKRSDEYASGIKLQNQYGEATVIRAACFDADGNLAGQVITQTYVCVASTEGLHYTVMLTCDEGDLNAMYRDVQAKVERAAHAEIIAPDGSRIISQDVGLRLFGGSSRALAQKSFKIIARKDGYFGDEPYVGLGTFTYPFFPERTVIAGKNAGEVLTKYDSLILRNGGNDSLLSTAEDGDQTTLLRDGICNEFIAKYAKNVGASYAHFAVVYLNGEYYGILELRENQNEDYVKRLYGVDDNDVVVVKSELDTTRACENHANGGACRFCGSWFFYETDEDTAAQAELKAWIALCKKAAGAVNASDAEYRKVFEEVAAKLDLENAKEYLAMSCYLVNTDWPHNNVRVWRYTGAAMNGISITDGKWRFATRDMDMAMARYATPSPLPELDNSATVDMFSWVLSNYVSGYGDQQEYTDALYLQGLFSFLMRDDTFRADFAAYCRTIASEEATAYLLTLYEDAYNQVNPIIGDHITRWKHHIASGFETRNWRKSAARIEKFIGTRSANFLKHLDKMLAMYD
ncbi:MAG: CotH kinase family protein [Clostridia bacterium]|nr:CotH kinase family protein [Clostridia bacterium]